MSAGRTALVVGGSAGIGLATAHHLAQRCAVVVLAGRDADRLRHAAEQFQEAAATVDTLLLDVGDAAAVSEGWAALQARYGSIDILVNSAGSAQSGEIGDISDDQWLGAFQTKVLGAVRMMRAVLPGMEANGFGRIINVAGTAGKEPDPWMVVPGTVNAALIAVSQATSRSAAASGVTVNAVCPGPTQTGRWDGLVAAHAARTGADLDRARHELISAIPTGHPASVDDVAALIGFLASEQARHITGTAINIDGGQARGY
ncbi:SDR family oxidoreductase [Tessaracoccus sp. MC1865]|uniref:SDR family oxidoreductase n=1 Tax=Tessaracoccus sp. MC1865 TaxID=2760310 RepID=UPI001603EF03|nr:SDR family oxidoreductase [Tessaracoccus sp. MC1865]MBB1482618.1 SDR family oxidoreductase [Tessaracoccus sp. MC1865]QTO37931.1 SDR family oxidoreductase [Tessaracoccus sp. MC1865]